MLQFHVRVYNSKEGAPASVEEMIPETIRGLFPSDLSNFVILTAEQKVYTLDNAKGNDIHLFGRVIVDPKATENYKSIRAIAVDKNTIPTIEKYLSDLNDLARLDALKLRPIEKLTREQVNTKEGRIKLHLWGEGFPNMLQSIYIRHQIDPLDPFTELAPIWSGRGSTEAERLQDEMKLYAIPETTPQYWGGLWGTNEGQMQYSKPLSVRGVMPNRYYDIDLAFAFDYGTEIKNAEEFEELIRRVAPPQAVEALLLRYKYSQFSIDSLWATYELFRTERFESIKGVNPISQRIAVSNYFATWRHFSDRIDRPEGYITLTYEKKKYVVTNILKELHIPEELKKYAREPIENPLAEYLNQSKRTATPEEPPQREEEKVGKISKEIRKERTLRGGQCCLYFDKKNNALLPSLGGVTLVEAVKIASVNDTINKKLNTEIINQLTTDPNFDLLEYAKQVAQVKKAQDVADLTIKNIEFNATELIRNIYGKVYGKAFERCKDNLEFRLRNYKNEPFIFFSYWEYTDINGREIRITTDQLSKDPKLIKGKNVKKHELKTVSPRFKFGRWIEHAEGDTKNLYCIIEVDPIHFANMIDSEGKLTNYDKLTPEYMRFIRSLRNDDYITPSVDKILQKEYDTIFPKAKQAQKTARNQAKTEGDTKPTNKELTAVYNAKFTLRLNKDAFRNDVLLNAGKNIELEPYEKTRINRDVEKALQSITQYNLYLQSYKSTKDNTAWELTFVNPYK